MAATVQAQDVIALFRQAYNEKWGYIWGASGQIHTQAAQDQATRAQTKKYGQQWVGKHVADCSGLFTWAYKRLGSTMYHGSNTMWNKYTTNKGQLQNGKRTDGKELRPGSAVFLTKGEDRHHVGLYVGDGKVIEAQSTAKGVVQSNLTRWDEWAELINTDYDTQTDTDVAEDEENNTNTSSTTMTTYTVQQGDTLWRLAQRFLGRGNRYKEIMVANSMTSTLLRPGMVLQIPSD